MRGAADAAQGPANDLIFHSDRGSTPFRKALAQAGLRQSMSARANPYDNAWTESFIGTLIHEMLQGGCFENTTYAHLEIFESKSSNPSKATTTFTANTPPSLTKLPPSSRPTSTPLTKQQTGPKIGCTSKSPSLHGRSTIEATLFM